MTQRAGAVDVEGGFQPRILPRVKPWLRGGTLWASGDGNPNDKTHGTFRAFPFYNMMNIDDSFGMLTLRPTPKVTTSSEFHSLRLADANDLWYSGGGAFQDTSFGYTGRATSGRKSLANLYDTSLDYQIKRNITATAYVGYAQGLAVMEQIYPRGKDGRFTSSLFTGSRSRSNESKSSRSILRREQLSAVRCICLHAAD